jgi:hypothetical protein
MGCSANKITKLDSTEEELIKQKSISISLATYSGASNYLSDMSNENTYKYLLDTLKLNDNKKIDVIKINSFVLNDDGSVNVVTEIYEKPFKTVLFHDMKFKKSNSKWVLVGFGADA